MTKPTMAIPAQPKIAAIGPALADLSEALSRWPLWWALSWQEIRQRYRGSILGPLWITLTMGATIGAIAVVYSQLLRVERQEYLPFLCTGIILWNLILGLINDGCTVFIRAHGIIRQTRLPLSLFVLKSVCYNFLLFAHYLLILLALVVFFPVAVGWRTFLAVPGLVAYALNGVWAGLLLGTLCARFRDIPPIVASVLQIAFFITPVIWQPDLIGIRPPIVEFNPFYHYLAVVRQPLLGQVASFESWGVVAICTILGWTLALVTFARNRRRIVFWV